MTIWAQKEEKKKVFGNMVIVFKEVVYQ